MTGQCHNARHAKVSCVGLLWLDPTCETIGKHPDRDLATLDTLSTFSPSMNCINNMVTLAVDVCTNVACHNVVFDLWDRTCHSQFLPMTRSGLPKPTRVFQNALALLRHTVPGELTKRGRSYNGAAPSDTASLSSPSPWPAALQHCLWKLLQLFDGRCCVNSSCKISKSLGGVNLGGESFARNERGKTQIPKCKTIDYLCHFSAS